MHTLSVNKVLEIYQAIMAQSGGGVGIRDLNAIKSALLQPFMTFDGKELYPTIIDKAAILGFSLIKNHPFLDGNKRIGHAVMEIFMVLNGFEIEAQMDEQEKIILQLAAGDVERETFTEWLSAHVKKKTDN
jgi:death-on-curing protein